MEILSRIFNNNQVQGVAERIVAALVLYFVNQGYIPVALSADLQTVIVAVVMLGWAWYVNRPNSIIKAANKLDKVERIETTDTALAADPSLAKVVPSTDSGI